MLQNKNLRITALAVCALGVAAAGAAVIATSDSPSARATTHAGTAARRTNIVQGEASHLTALGSRPSANRTAALNAAFDGPAPAARTTDRPASRQLSIRGTSTAPVAPAHTPLVSAHVGNGPTTVQVDTDQVLDIAGTTVKSATSTVASTVTWTTSTVNRTVQSLPVKASATRDGGTTTVTVSLPGTSASAHVG